MRNVKKVVHVLLGIMLILCGIAGLILPILNGTILLLVGFILLSFESSYIEQHLTRLANKSNFTAKWYEKLLHMMNRLFGR